MIQDEQQQHKSPISKPGQALHWLRNTIITLLLLLAVGLLVGSQLIHSTSIKEKLQTIISEQTGAQIDYQEINFSFLPRLGIELLQVTLILPEHMQATTTNLRLSPEFLPLLTGKLQVAKVELESPKIKLEVPVTKPKVSPTQSFSVTAVEKKLAKGLAPLVQVIPNLALNITNAALAISQSKHKLFDAEGLNLQLKMSVTDPHTARTTWQTTVSQLSIYQDDSQETIKDVLLSGSLQVMADKMTLTLDQLALAEPPLELTGDLTLASTTPAIKLNISSSNLDVDAVRKTTLSLAGDTTPIKEIFSYLRGGQIPQISFSSKGETPSDLGDLNNIQIEGRLQEGMVSIPEIELDLTEVIGDVIISKGVLQGSHMSTRLEGSSGRDGSLKVALGDDNDLFQLDLMLDADLGKAQTILARVVDAPAFIAELNKITQLHGTGRGRLTLGDSLNDINARVEIDDLQLSAHYQSVPFPITIKQGQFTFNEKQIGLGKLGGTLGNSKFTNLSGQLLWEKALSLAINSGKFDLDMTELYPWLASQERLREQLKDISKVTGRLELSSLKFTGAIDKPSKWRFSSTGAVKLSARYQSVPFPITIKQGQFTFSEKQIGLGKLDGTLGNSKFTNLSGQLLWEKALFLAINSGKFDLDMTELYPWLASQEGLREQLKDISKMTGRLNLSSLKLKGAIDKPSKWKLSSTGTVKNISIKTGFLPETIHFTKGGFKVDPQQLSFNRLQITSQDAAFTLTGSLKGFPQQLERVEISADGHMDVQAVKWLSEKFEVPEAYTIHTPLTISQAKITWLPDMSSSFNGLVSIADGPKITAIVDYQPDQLQVHQLTVKDQYSDVNMVFDLKKNQRDITFNGKLQNETVQALFVDHQATSAQLEGNFSLILPQDKQSSPTAEGWLTGKKLAVLLPTGETVEIEQVKLNAKGSQVEVDISKAKYLSLTWEPIKAAVTFGNNSADIKFTKAKMCGINSPGLFSIVGNEFSFDMSLEGKGLDVATSYTCLRGDYVKMTGSLDFSSQVTAKGQIGDLLENLQGPLKMTFSKGVIEENEMLARTLEVLNVTEIFKGRLPNLDTTGLPYNSINIDGKFKKGKLLLPKLFMDGETLDLVGHGQIDLEKETIDAQLLAAPFKTIDSIVNKIPGISYILGGGLVTIPVAVTGKLEDPKVSVMSPSAVGTSLLDLGERILKSPFKLFESLIPFSNKD